MPGPMWNYPTGPCTRTRLYGQMGGRGICSLSPVGLAVIAAPDAPISSRLLSIVAAVEVPSQCQRRQSWTDAITASQWR